MLIFALLGMVAIAPTRPARRDPRLAGLIVFGGFFILEAAFLSFSKGIVHPYYVSALAPGTAVMVGAGLSSMGRLPRRRFAVLLLSAVILTAALQVALLHHAHYLRAWQILLIPAAVLAAVIALRTRRYSGAALAGVLAILLVAPTVYAATTWRLPVQGTFPAAGPHAVEGNGGAGLSRAQLATTDALMRYVIAHGANGRFQLLTEASLTADSPILLGLRASALGGYGGVDPALNGPGLAHLVASGQARYVLIGDGYSYLGGNAASRAAASVCPEVPLTTWRGAGARASNGLYLVDCAGRVRELAEQP
jgi:4-amino-4-deoxy-L-arabinose transferase-like glycosyltransferase